MTDLAAYMIVFDAQTLTSSADQLHRYVIENKFTVKWWNHLPLVYVIASRKSHTYIWTHIHDYLGVENSFIVTKIDPEQTDGHLPSGAWKGFVDDIESYIASEDGET